MSARQAFRRRSAAIVFVAASAACGTSELPVDPAFDGLWAVAGVELASADSDAADTASADVERAGLLVEIDTGEAAVRGRTGCGEFFGSYTLIDEGESTGPASFTVPSPAPDAACPAADRVNHVALVEALETVTQWRQEPAAGALTMELTSPSGTRVLLTPAG